MRVIRSITLTLLVMSLATANVVAQDKYSGTPAARAEVDKAVAAKRANDWDKAVAAYKKAIELDPNFAQAHMSYLEASLMANAFRAMKSGEPVKASKGEASDPLASATKEYEQLVRQNPKSPVYRWILGWTYTASSPETKEKYCKEAIDLDPEFGPAYGCLAAVSTLRGDKKTTVSYLKKGIAISPNDKDLWRRLQDEVQGDPQELKDVTTEIVNRFPDDDAAVMALYQYADKLPEAERISKLEEIVAKYPLKKFRFASLPASLLFSYYDRTDPAKAAAFANKIAEEMPNDPGWKGSVAYEESMAAAESKLAANDGAGALEILKNTNPGLASPTRLQLLKAKAQDISGDTQNAYADLLKLFAKEPVPQMQPVLYQYGQKLGKNAKTVDDEVWALRSANAKPAIPFSLESFVDGKKVSLEDFKGKVVMLDFWYPSCGPCLLAMPYMQQLWSKYKDSGLVFLGINGMEGEANLVMPLVKARGWGFIPLKGTEKWGKDVYQVQGYPSTFLIGADGKVYFRPHTYDQEHSDIAEMEIKALLAAAQSNKNEQPK